MDRVGPAIHPVILSGGVGSRLWPMSRALYPKQLLPLASSNTMLEDTLLRVAGPHYAPPVIVCNDEHRFLIAESLRRHAVEADRIVLEPVGRNTAPAIAAAALLIAEQDREGLMLVMPSDHIVTDATAFQAAVGAAKGAAAEGFLVSFGITPTRPETGYGYIRHSRPLDGHPGVFAVDRFVEKPDRATAEGYLAEGGYAWNSGIFLFSAAAVLDELERFEPAILEACRQAVADAATDLDFFRLNADAFATAPSTSIDYAVMERTTRAAVVPVDMGWSDVGSWNALWDIGTKDDTGNVLQGDVLTHDVRNSYIRTTERPLVAAVGVEDLVIVATDDAVLVTQRDRAQDTREVVARLEALDRPERLSHSTVYRPWGCYRTIDVGDRFQVKQITVRPGALLSLQYHHHRAEHWVVVEGTAEVTCDGRTFLLHENESTYIPPGKAHRLANPGKLPLRLIEVQSGSYLGEDDIVRLEDTYGRP